MSVIEWAERGMVPDFAIRLGIVHLLRRRLARPQNDQERLSTEAFAETLRSEPLAVGTDAANVQHYEVPAEFFRLVLGPRLKYSCCDFESPHTSLADAEESMLRQTCQRAELQDGMRVLDLGCGWGSLSLWICETFPNCRVTAVSNSHSQRDYILRQARERGYDLEVITADMCDFDTEASFDRILSVEMFEHMRNYELLLQRVAGWLAPDGKVLVHIFCHREHPYLFEDRGQADWMARHFFTGGMMPSVDLLGEFSEHLHVTQRWPVNGKHYWRTSEAWLQNLDRHREQLWQRFRADLSPREASLQLQRWRMFFLACAELFRYNGGEEWFVMHYLLAPTSPPARTASPPHSKLKPVAG